MKFTGIIFVFALAIASAGCASQHHTIIEKTSPATTASAPSKSQAENSGWYLMQPPVGPHHTIETSAKLSDWNVIAFFERASQCDDARHRGLAAYPSYLAVSESSPSNSIEMSQRLAAATLCVAADDPKINWFYFEWK